MSDETLKVVLVAVGWTFETLGIVLIAAAELVPRLRRFGSRIVERLRVMSTTIRRWISRPRHGRVFAKAGGAIAGASASVTAVVSVSDAAPAERKIEFLLEQVESLQQRISGLENQVRELPKRWAREIDASRTDVEGGRSEEHSRYLGTNTSEHGCSVSRS